MALGTLLGSSLGNFDGSLLGSLLAAAGEHLRLIAQHEDSLEVEITSLDWLGEGERAPEGSRSSDG